MKLLKYIFPYIAICCISIEGFSQTNSIFQNTIADSSLLSTSSEAASLPSKVISPYLNLLAGFSTLRSGRYTLVAAAFDLKIGIITKQFFLVETGISALSIDTYELGVTLPIEVGLRSPSQRWEFKAGVGYLFVNPWWRDNSIHPEDLTGRTLSVDASWRPTILQERVQLVIAAGGVMYDLGSSRFLSEFCSVCNQEVGPRYSFRLRAGIGL